jgi:hypothetical protein
MRRRNFVVLLGGTALAEPPATQAQQPAMPVIGYLGTAALNTRPDIVSTFHDGLKETVATHQRAGDLGAPDALPAPQPGPPKGRRKVAVTTARAQGRGGPC